MSRAPRAERARWQQADTGAVSFEFVIVVFPILLVFLAVTQLSLIGVARLVVMHAASRAARSAAVVVDDSPSRYGGEPIGHLDDSAIPHGAHLPGELNESSGVGAILGGTGTRSRLDTIRLAASMPLSTIAPSVADVLGWIGQIRSLDVTRALGSPSLLRIASGVALYSDVALVVVPSLDADDVVRVHVDYVFHCAVPVAERIICRHVPTDPSQLPNVPDRLALQRLALTLERFVTLSADAAWPRQRYHDGGGDG